MQAGLALEQLEEDEIPEEWEERITEQEYRQGLEVNEEIISKLEEEEEEELTSDEEIEEAVDKWVKGGIQYNHQQNAQDLNAHTFKERQQQPRQVRLPIRKRTD